MQELKPNPLKAFLDSKPAIILLTYTAKGMSPEGPFLARYDKKSGKFILPVEFGSEVRLTECAFKSAKKTKKGVTFDDALNFRWLAQGFHKIPADGETQWMGLTLEHLRALQSAIDIYVRLGIGQFEIVGEAICELHHEKAAKLDKTSWDFRDEVFGPLKAEFGFAKSGSYGIANPKTPQTAKIAHDLGNIVNILMANCRGTSASNGLKTANIRDAKFQTAKPRI